MIPVLLVRFVRQHCQIPGIVTRRTVSLLAFQSNSLFDSSLTLIVLFVMSLVVSLFFVSFALMNLLCSPCELRGRFDAKPRSISNPLRSVLKQTSSILPVLAAVSLSRTASAADVNGPLPANAVGASAFANLPFGSQAYSTIGDVTCCKILNGMWQVSGAHGYKPDKQAVVAKMTEYAEKGYTTFDLADIYGPAEDYVGAFTKGRMSSSRANDCSFFTKWVPYAEPVTKQGVTDAIDRSLLRMRSDRLDLLQFHWWDYDNKYYYDAVHYLMQLQDDDKIHELGLTNFDTEHLVDLLDQGAPIKTNQVSFSVLDTRPQRRMLPAIKELGADVQLLCYGTLLGGFISPQWLGKSEPTEGSLALSNVSLRKYLPWVRAWGGWDLFQELLRVLDKVGHKHSVSLSSVALKWVLDQPGVAGAIVGVRFGLPGHDHFDSNAEVFGLQLDDEDRAAIATVQQKSRSLMTAYGDCGCEYRRRRRA